LICTIVCVLSPSDLLHHLISAFYSCIETSWIVMCSSAAAAISHDMVQEFSVTPVQSRLPIAMFLFGMSIGPVVLTPLAEVSTFHHIASYRI
jgi:hypothetical protein